MQSASWYAIGVHWQKKLSRCTVRFCAQRRPIGDAYTYCPIFSRPVASV